MVRNTPISAGRGWILIHQQRSISWIGMLKIFIWSDLQSIGCSADLYILTVEEYCCQSTSAAVARIPSSTLTVRMGEFIQVFDQPPDASMASFRIWHIHVLSPEILNTVVHYSIQFQLYWLFPYVFDCFSTSLLQGRMNIHNWIICKYMFKDN